MSCEWSVAGGPDLHVSRGGFSRHDRESHRRWRLSPPWPRQRRRDVESGYAALWGIVIRNEHAIGQMLASITSLLVWSDNHSGIRTTTRIGWPYAVNRISRLAAS